jgi:hypothetical protein
MISALPFCLPVRFFPPLSFIKSWGKVTQEERSHVKSEKINFQGQKDLKV